ncbi:MAG: antitoxin [Desulfobacterales bacterium]
MKSITLRGIDSETSEKLKQKAKNQGKSTNKLILEMIRKQLGIEKEKTYSRKYSDLDDLFGRWSEDEFREITGKIQQERLIDPELWS